METQRGIAPRFFAGEDIANIINSDGVGKALIYGEGDEEVLEGTEAGYADFAGVAITVDPEATVTRTNALVNAGGRSVIEGDSVGVLNDHMIDVLVTGTVAFKDFLTLADDGKFQKLTLSATPTATELMQIVGRVMAGRTGAGQTKAHIWVRK